MTTRDERMAKKQAEKAARKGQPRPLPTVQRDGQTFYDFDMFTQDEKVAFLLQRVNALEGNVNALKGAFGEVADFVHVLAALVRKTHPLTASDGTPLGLTAFLEVVAREAQAYQVAMDPTVTGEAAQLLEAQSLSHRIQDTLKATRAEGIKAMASILEKIKADARAEAEAKAAQPPVTETTPAEGEKATEV